MKHLKQRDRVEESNNHRVGNEYQIARSLVMGLCTPPRAIRTREFQEKCMQRDGEKIHLV